VTIKDEMKAVTYLAPGKVAVRDLPIPQLRSDRDAVVRVSRSAICGTDLHAYRGELPHFPAGTVLGHEFAGTIYLAGSEVPFRPGQRVFASDIVACGRCGQCGRGRHYQCASVSLFGYADVVGEPVDGGQADVVLAATPDDITDEQALLVGDVLTTAYAAVRNTEVQAGDLAVVVGAGPLGVLAALCLQDAGARVLIADPDLARREHVAGLGWAAVPPAELAASVRAANGGEGAHRVVEAVGTDAALAVALDASGPAAVIAVAGAHHSTAMSFPSGLAFARELTLRFTVGDPISLRDEVLRFIRSGRCDPAVIFSHRLPLSAAPAAYDLFNQRKALKAVFSV
jgi:2-desacetyl-2-hydroxyethyl bacteriochlorophyllide A dehydrogenase